MIQIRTRILSIENDRDIRLGSRLARPNRDLFGALQTTVDKIVAGPRTDLQNSRKNVSTVVAKDMDGLRSRKDNVTRKAVQQMVGLQVDCIEARRKVARWLR